MKLYDHIKLVPRNNWDYGFKALFNAFAAMDNHVNAAPNVEYIFNNKVIWTISGKTSPYVILGNVN
jgi:hypothetical protein